MKRKTGKRTTVQCLATKLAATLTILVAREILLLKQIMMSKMMNAKTKQITAAMIEPVVPEGLPVTGLVGETSKYTPVPTKAAIARKMRI